MVKKNNKDKKYFYFLITAVIAGASFYFLYTNETNAPVSYIQPASSTQEKADKSDNSDILGGINFSKEGNMVWQNNAWYLLYENNKIASSSELKFDLLSICLVSGQRINCANAGTNLQGIRVSVKGVKTDNSILVKSLATIDNR